MKCKKCGSKLENFIEMDKCPFCGACLKEEETPTEFSNISSVIRYLMDKEGEDVLLNSNIVMSYIMDLVKGQDREKKLFRMGGNNGVLERIHKTLSEEKQSKREILVLNLKRHLMDNAFISEENAIELIDMTLEGISLPELKLTDTNKTSQSTDLTRSTKTELKDKTVNKLVRTTAEPAISAGTWHTVGLKSDRTVITIGFNRSGQYNVSDWKDVVAISAGDYYTVGLKSDGTVIAVGYNNYRRCNVSGWNLIK